MLHLLETMLSALINYTMICFEMVGVLVIIISGLKAIYEYIKKSESVRLDLAQGLALGLEFKLGSEILRTVLIRDFSEVALVAAIIAIRAALTLLIHWEIKEEEKSTALHHSLESETAEATKKA